MAAILIQRSAEILLAIADNPLIYMPLIGSWLITAVYFIINNDEQHGHTYVMSTGIAHIFTAYMISPLAIPNISWSLSDLRTIVVIVLFVYGAALSVLGIMRTFPDMLAEFFGDPGHALVPGLMAILFVHDNIPFDWTSFIIIFVPVFIISVIKIIRRLGKSD